MLSFIVLKKRSARGEFKEDISSENLFRVFVKKRIVNLFRVYYVETFKKMFRSILLNDPDVFGRNHRKHI